MQMRDHDNRADPPVLSCLGNSYSLCRQHRCMLISDCRSGFCMVHFLLPAHHIRNCVAEAGDTNKVLARSLMLNPDISFSCPKSFS